MKLLIALLAGITLVSTAAEAAKDVDSPPQDGLVLWLCGDRGIQGVDGRVVEWRDQSSHENHATAKPDHVPEFDENGFGEQPALRFDDDSTCMTVAHSAELNAVGDFTVFVAYRFTDGFRIAQKKDNSSGLVPDAWFLTTRQGLGIGGKYLHATPLRERQPHLQASVFDADAGTINIYDSGTLIHTLKNVEPQQPNSDPLRIGKRDNPDGTEGHLEGVVAELLIYDRALSNDERMKVEAYLTERYEISRVGEPLINITRVIPASHAVTIHWQKPQINEPAGDLQYRLETKLRDQSWEQATCVELPFGQRQASNSGMLNHADYALRLLLRNTRTNEQIGASAERLVTPAEIPGTVIDYLHRHDDAYWQWGQYIGSPSIAMMPDGRLVASHDLFGPGSSDHTRIFISGDAGETWSHAAELDGSFWGKLFTHRQQLYLLTTRQRFGDVLIYHSPDGGSNWSEPTVIAPGSYHKAPVPVKVHDGRLWTCVEMKKGGWPEGFQAVALSVPEDDNLMNADNWTVSNPLPYNTEWLPEGMDVDENDQGYLEGNVVIDPEGRLLNILRYNIPPYHSHAIVLRIDPDGGQLHFDRVVDLPGGMKKFTIRHDADTHLYWSLVNRVTKPNACGMRSVLSLICSEDLDHWRAVDDILRDDRQFAVKYTGFQYADWLFDGQDIIAVVRMGFNGAHNMHDANHLTFHRIENYAQRVPK